MLQIAISEIDSRQVSRIYVNQIHMLWRKMSYMLQNFAVELLHSPDSRLNTDPRVNLDLDEASLMNPEQIQK